MAVRLQASWAFFSAEVSLSIPPASISPRAQGCRSTEAAVELLIRPRAFSATVAHLSASRRGVHRA